MASSSSVALLARQTSAQKPTFSKAGARSIGLAAGLAAAAALFGVTGAQAQNCNQLTVPVIGNITSLASSAISSAVTATSEITASNTAFLTQSTAFVSAPGNPQPNQEGGGIWVRGVGGELTLKSNQTLSGTASVLGIPVGSATTTCATQYHQSFGGFQVGADVAKLNIGGWNVHIGTTAGALESSGNIVGGSPVGGQGVPVTQVPFNSSAQSPFVGTYAVVTNGGFFADAMVRYNTYQLNLNSPGSNIFNQNLDAHGYAVNGSVGYNYAVPNSRWFIEPSAGLIWSRTSVGSLNVDSAAFGPGVQGFSGTVQINDINSLIGRAGLRVGTTFESGNLVLQPFVAASVWHEFDGDITASYQSCANCLFVFGFPGSLTGSLTTSNIGTYGQYSVGVSGQLANTGWLGFARVDYRDGNNLQGLSATGGIRYQFTPGAVAAAMPVKARPLYKAPPAALVSWTGWYIGGFGGADWGRGELNAVGASAGLYPGGVLAGGTLGYNYQMGQYVLGVEGDMGWTNLAGAASCAPLVTGLVTTPPFFQTTCHERDDWIATVAARLGYLWTPRTLLYLKGGAAWDRETWSASCNLGPLNGTLAGTLQACTNPAGALISSISASTIRTGGLVGFGTEFALTPSWSAKAEYDWIGFGSGNLTLSDGTVVNTKSSISETKIGLDYHFNTAAIAARY